MKSLRRLVCTAPFLLLLYAAPAFAQFEVAPDHLPADDEVVSQTLPKPSVASARNTARRPLGTAASQQPHTQHLVTRRARTSSSGSAQPTRAQHRSHARKASLSARASATVQAQPTQVAQVPRE